MKQIPLLPAGYHPRGDKLANKVARRKPKVYNGKYDSGKWVRGMEKSFTLLEVPEEKKLDIRTYYLTSEANIWWNTIKGRLVGPEFTWSKFLQELRVKFCPVMVQRQKEKEFIELMTSGSMTLLKYASKFTERSRLSLNLCPLKD